jgi:hypothetical protein
VKLRAILDEMFSPILAAQLVERGHDVVAVKALPRLIKTPDDELLVEATAQRRILVTRNIKDFEPIADAWQGLGHTHAGLIYLTSTTFPADASFLGAAVRSLTAAAQADQLPRPGEVLYLRRVSGD